MIWPSLANALDTWAALRSLKASKLPRSVLPSMATQTGAAASSAAAVGSSAACWRNTRSSCSPSRPRRMNRNVV